jgi:hypothetical protein
VSDVYCVKAQLELGADLSIALLAYSSKSFKRMAHSVSGVVLQRL